MFKQADRDLLHAKLDNIQRVLAGTSLMSHDQRVEKRDKEMQDVLYDIRRLLVPTKEYEDALPNLMFNIRATDRIGRLDDSQAKLLAALDEISDKLTTLIVSMAAMNANFKFSKKKSKR